MDYFNTYCLATTDSNEMCFEPKDHEGDHVFREISITLTPALDNTEENN